MDKFHERIGVTYEGAGPIQIDSPFCVSWEIMKLYWMVLLLVGLVSCATNVPNGSSFKI